jgi:hypothetical protein
MFVHIYTHAHILTLINPSPFYLDNYKMSGTLFIIDYRWVLFKILYFDIA